MSEPEKGSFKRDDGFKRDSFKRDDSRGGGFRRDDSRGGGFKRDDSRGGGFKRDDSRGGGFKRDDSRGGGFKRDDSRGGGFKQDGFKKFDKPRDDVKGMNPKDQINMVKDLAKILSEKGLTELEVGFKDGYIRISQQSYESRSANMVRPTLSIQSIDPTSQHDEASAQHATSDKDHFVTSPCVGTAYLSPSPDADHFVKAGMHVEKGQSVLIIEAMKVMNAIEAPVSGIVKEILVTNEQPVEFGQNLVLIESD